MNAAILGAGIQGCCAALELADHGVQVDLIDRADTIMGEASRWNEGKLHLGYVYAKDASLATARIMIAGSLSFVRFFEHRLGGPIPDDRWSSRFVYGVLHDGQLTVDEQCRHFEEIDRLVNNAWAGGKGGYPGLGDGVVTRDVTGRGYFNDTKVAATYSTIERSIDTGYIARVLKQLIDEHPGIRILTGRSVSGGAA